MNKNGNFCIFRVPVLNVTNVAWIDDESHVCIVILLNNMDCLKCVLTIWSSLLVSAENTFLQNAVPVIFSQRSIISLLPLPFLHSLFNMYTHLSN